MSVNPWQVAIRETKEYLIKQQQKVQQTTHVRMARQTHWKPPEGDMLKLNTDGTSMRECGLAGCGGLLRDRNGTWRGDYSKSLGWCTAHVAELWGVYEGRQLAQRKGYNNLVVEIDADQIVKNLQNATLGRGEGWILMKKIIELLNNPGWSVQFQHVSREANICAHKLAALGRHQPESLVVHDTIPTELIKAVNDDLLGIG